jgi:hypothetical protein
MLPDYPEIKRKLLINFQKHMIKETQQDTLMKVVQKKPIYEGNNLEINSISGHSKRKGFQTISTEFRIKPEDLIEKGLDAYYSKFSEITEEMRKKQSKILIEAFEETTNQTGNIVDCKSKPMAEWYLEVLDKVSIIFDEFGNPTMPDIFVSPDDYERIKSDYSKLQFDPNIKEKIREIVERKRREWIDKENNRKLVD